MANVIQIKRGSGAPASLLEGELGLDKTGGVLYVGVASSSIIRVGPYALTSKGNSTQPVYVNSSGNIVACTAYSSASVSYAATAGAAAYVSSSAYTVGATDQPVYFKNGLPVAISSLTLTGTVTLTKTQDASGTADNKPALIVGGATTASHIEIDGNEILAKANGTTPGELNLQDSTGVVKVNGSGGLVVTKGGATINSGGLTIDKGGATITSGNLSVNNGGIQLPNGTPASDASTHWISAGTGYGNGSGKNGIKIAVCEQNDCTTGLGNDLTSLTGGYELTIATTEGTGGNGYISFAKHTVAAPSSYTRLGYFDKNGNLTITGAFKGGISYGSTAPASPVTGQIWLKPI